jgi:hypothetical protein
MNRSAAKGEWSDWRLVCSESQLVAALKRGFFIAPSLDDLTNEHSDGELVLVRNAEVYLRAGEVRDPNREIGEPVSVRWKKTYLRDVIPQLNTVSEDRFPTPFGLALYSQGVQVGFVADDRSDALAAFLENQTLANSFLSNGEVDDLLTNRTPKIASRGKGLRGSETKHDVGTSEQLTLEIVEQTRNIRKIGVVSVRHERLASLEREERFQCATELAHEIAEDREQLEFAACLARQELDRGRGLNEDLLALFHMRVGSEPRTRQPLARVAQHILETGLERRNSPMTNEVKIQILELITKEESGVGESDRTSLFKILSLVQADEPLGSLDLSKMSAWVQGFTLFFLHSGSPSEILGISRSYFAVGPEAVSIAAFLVGLRFRRDSYVSDQVFLPLRDLHVRRAVEVLNDRIDDGKKVEITATQTSIMYGDTRFLPAREMRVFEVDNALLYIDVTKDEVYTELATRIIVPIGVADPKLKFGKKDFPKQNFAALLRDHSEDLKRSIRPTRKGRRSFFQFADDNRLYDELIEQTHVAILQFKGPVWISTSDSNVKRFESPKVTIREGRLLDALGITNPPSAEGYDPKALKKIRSEVRRRFPTRFLTRRERVEIDTL